MVERKDSACGNRKLSDGGRETFLLRSPPFPDIKSMEEEPGVRFVQTSDGNLDVSQKR